MSSTLRPGDYLIAAGLALVVLLLGLALMVPGVCGVFHDDAIYVATAKALATGQGYRLINLPGSPLQTKYPLLYPALLALIWKLWPSFPNNLIIMQVLNVVLGALAVGWGYLYLIRWSYAGPWAAGLAGLLTATAPWYLYFCGLTMSEELFALAVIGTAWALESYLRLDQPRLGQAFGLGLLLALPGYIRLIGLVFIPLGLALIWRRRQPLLPAAIPCLILLLALGSWMLYGRPRQEMAFLSYYRDYLSWWLAISQMVWLRIIITNLFFTLSFAFGLLNPDFFQFADAAKYLWWPALLGGTAILVALGRQLIQARVLPVFLLGYLTVVLLWPWPPIRFLIPLLPFFLAFPLELGCRGAQGRPASWLNFTTGGLVIGVLILNFFLVCGIAGTNSRSGYPLPQEPKKMADQVNWADFQELLCWIKENTSSQDLIASNLDTMIYLYTGRQGFRPYFEDPKLFFYQLPGTAFTSPGETASIMPAQRANYLIQTPMPLFAAEPYWFALVNELQHRYPRWLQLVYIGRDPRFKVFALRPGQEPKDDRGL